MQSGAERGRAALEAELLKLRQELESERTANEALRRENLALAERIHQTPAPALPAPPQDVADVGHASVEQLLYAKALDAYREKNAVELSRSVQLILKSNPDGDFADNAAWLEADLILERGAPDEALRLFEQAIARYPTGNKAAALWLGKAKALEALHRPSQAQETLRRLAALYPGSPEQSSAAQMLRSGNERKTRKAESPRATGSSRAQSAKGANPSGDRASLHAVARTGARDS